ncbi:MAG TPA: amidase [Thermomicrobiales bacterium]|nr:amidase [Thermomicrobiales bacterium]
MLARTRISRRALIQRSAMAAAGTAVAGLAATTSLPSAMATGQWNPVHQGIEEATIADMQAAMEAGTITSRQLVGIYLERIAAYDLSGPMLCSVLHTNAGAALRAAEELDNERVATGPRGPLHGIPVLLKDNIDVVGMPNTGGSVALANNYPLQDATVAAKLRDAGAVIIGKTNLSEWANFRGAQSSSGWSGLGRQTKNPYYLSHNPCGSSSGSGTAISANLAAVALGTETDGSIVCPSNNTGLVGIKPTVGLTSRAGVIPISHTQDTVGPMARTVADAAAVLGALTGVDPRDPATAASAEHAQSDYLQYLDADALAGARIGVPRTGGYWGYSPEADAICNAAIEKMRELGAEIIDPADIPTAAEIATSPAEFTVLLYEFEPDLNAYLATMPGDVPTRTLADLIAFNIAYAGVELPYFGQELFEQAHGIGSLTDAAYLEALETSLRLSRTDGIDAVMDEYDLDALVAPTGSPAWPTDVVNGDHFLGASSSPAAMAGYPLVTLPAGDSFGLPVGLTFMGRAWSEPTLIALAYAFEQATKHRRSPEFLPTRELP